MADSNKAGILFIDILVERAKKAMKRVETFEEEEMQMDEEQWEKPDLDAYPPSDIQQLVLCHKDPESVLTARSLVSPFTEVYFFHLLKMFSDFCTLLSLWKPLDFVLPLRHAGYHKCPWYRVGGLVRCNDYVDCGSAKGMWIHDQSSCHTNF